MIKVYTKPACQPCKVVKRMFSDSELVEGRDYEVIDVSENPKARDWLVDSGFRSVPVVTHVFNQSYVAYKDPEDIPELIKVVESQIDWDGTEKDGRWLH